MCGIAGILLRPDSANVPLLASIGEMSSTLHHRGPDGAGVWSDYDARIALGHRRLSILDLSSNGHQPMVSASGDTVVTYNGEVFNCDELRAELTDAGYRFKGHSDTEVMLAAFDHYGVDRALSRFVGFFAFGLWNRRTRILHLARDRIGKKPLYIALTPDGLLFASELKALLSVPGFQPQVNPEALASVLSCGYVKESQCIWKSVFKLPPGGLLSIRPEDVGTATVESLQRKIHKWWVLADVAARGQRQLSTLTDNELIDRLDELLRAAVKQRMIADVPLGAFLSGGVDSSIVAALMQANSGVPVRTFTMGFHEAEYNESHHASSIARHLGTKHLEMMVTPKEAQEVIPELPRVWDEPFADESAIPTLLVSRLARKHVTVALTGDGGDECFGGYVKHFMGQRIARLLKLPAKLRKSAAWMISALSEPTWDTIIRSLPGGSRAGSGLSGQRLQTFARIIDARNDVELYHRLAHFGSPMLLLTSDYLDTIPGEIEPDLQDLPSRFMYRDMNGYLPSDILVKVDRASMAASLEVRSPLLDHRVVEFAWSLPTSVKVRAGRGKWLLRETLARYVPNALLERQKQGFNVPINEWLRGPLREWAEELLNERRIASEGLLHARSVQVCWQEHLSGRRDRFKELWSILMIQAWFESVRTGYPSSSASISHAGCALVES